jgi:hypothetical protein
MKIDWKKDSQSSKNSSVFLGPWNVGSVQFEGSKYTALIGLPGVSGRIGTFDAEDKAKEAVEKDIKYWFGKLPK